MGIFTDPIKKNVGIFSGLPSEGSSAFQNFSFGSNINSFSTDTSTPATLLDQQNPIKTFGGAALDFAKSVPSLIKSIPKAAVQDLLVTPAVRATQATASIFGTDNPVLQGTEDISISTPFGDYTVPAQKTGLSGAKQIVGQGLTAASWLLTPEAFMGVGKGVVTNAVFKSIQEGAPLAESVVRDAFFNTTKQGFKSGAIIGTIQGFGSSLSQDKNISETLKDAAIGGLFGAALGGTTAGAMAGFQIVKNKAGFLENTLVKELTAKGVPEEQAKTFATQAGFFKNPFSKTGETPPGLPQENTTLSQKLSSQTDPSSVPPPSQVNVSSPESTPIPDPVKQITEALKAATPIRETQEALYSAERSKRIGAVVAVGKSVPGEQGYFAQLSKLKGELPKVQFESIRKNVTQPNVDALFNIVEKANITPFEKITAKTGLSKLLGAEGGVVPTRGELSLLGEIFPPEFIQAVTDKRPFMEKLWGTAKDALNIPRAIMATADLSAPLRQGLFMISQPKEFTKSFASMFKYAFSEDAYKGLMEGIKSDPVYLSARENKLALTDVGTDLTKREESFMSNIVEKIPLFGRLAKASNRAYSGFLTKLRFDVFKNLSSQATELGITDNPKVIADIAKFVNTATGRGDLPAILKNSQELLNGAFFSPRLMASRLQTLNPGYYVGLEPFVRKQALKSLFTVLGVGTTVLSLAKLNGASVSVDPRNADFGKIKVDDTRYDIWGGLQQYVVLASRLITGQMVNSTTGREFNLGEGYKPTTRLDIIQRFFESKTSPIASFALGLLKGQTATGEKLNIPADIADRFLPMVASDMFDLYRESGPKGLGMAIPGVFGIGVQTYSDQIPMKSKTPTGKDSITWRQAPTLAETLINKVTGKQVTTIPLDQQAKLRQEKLIATERQLNLDKAKALVLASGEPQDVGDTHVFLDNGIVKTSTSDTALFYSKVQALKDAGKIDEAVALMHTLTNKQAADYQQYKKTRNSNTLKSLLKSDPVEAVKFLRSQTLDEQQRLGRGLSPEEIRLYESGK